MLISGAWHRCDDGLARPVMHAEILARDGAWIKAPCLLDTGADRTVFSADILQALHLPLLGTQTQLGGVGEVIAALIIETQMRLTRENNGKGLLRGQYAGVTEVGALCLTLPPALACTSR